MTKKILIISSSPRKGGNSEILCNRFIQGAEESGKHAEKILLSEMRINFCTACDACKKNGRQCIQKDDMAPILEKMVEADAIVLATPVYFYTMSGQLKSFIDRLYSRYEAIRNKDFYLILTAAENSRDAVQRTVEEFRGLLECLPLSTEKGIVYGLGAWGKGEIQGNKAMDDAYDYGKNS